MPLAVEPPSRGQGDDVVAGVGWYTAAVTMRLLVESELNPAGGIVGVGFDEFRWPHPVRPGDELTEKSQRTTTGEPRVWQG